MADQPAQHPGRIQVSTSKKPIYFYVNLAKRLMEENGEVQLSALGQAISTAVTVAEILKKDKLAVEKKLQTAFEVLETEVRGKPISKPKVAITLRKSEDFDRIIKEQAEQEAQAAARQQQQGAEVVAAA